MNIVKQVQIRDYFIIIKPKTYTFFLPDFDESRKVASQILLKPETARTNVILRDSKGRFVSYRKLGATGSDGIIGTTMAILKPFPVGYAF